MPASAIDWNQFYLTARHLEAWELTGPSPELKEVLATLPAGEGRVAVDLGCGTGSDCIFLARRGYRTYGIDVSEVALALARRRAVLANVDVEWRCADVLALPLSDGVADLVADRGCFHHIAERDRDVYAAEVHRVLKPGGYLFLRGCRLRQLPFIAVTEEAVRRYFPPEYFEIAIAPIGLVTDRRVLSANACWIVRR